MTGPTHVVCSVSATAVLAVATAVEGTNYMSMSFSGKEFMVPIVLAGSALGALVIDIDIEGSTISNKVAVIQRKIRRFMYIFLVFATIAGVGLFFTHQTGQLIPYTVGVIGAALILYILSINPHKYLTHRGITHTGIVTAIVIHLGMTSMKTIGDFVFGIGIGMLFHIVADMFNSKGCPIFWPVIPKKIPGIMSIKTRTRKEALFKFVWLAICVAAIGVLMLGGGLLNA